MKIKRQDLAAVAIKYIDDNDNDDDEGDDNVVAYIVITGK